MSVYGYLTFDPDPKVSDTISSAARDLKIVHEATKKMVGRDRNVRIIYRNLLSGGLHILPLVEPKPPHCCIVRAVCP